MVDLECPRCGSVVSVGKVDMFGNATVQEDDETECEMCKATLRVGLEEIGECSCELEDDDEHCPHAEQGYIEYSAYLVDVSE